MRSFPPKTAGRPAEHHRNISYQEEIRELFKRHRVASTNTMFGIEAPEGRMPFQGGSLYLTSPRAGAPDFAKPTSRLAFWRHLPQHEGRHSFSDGGLGYSVRPLRGRKKMSKLQRESQATPLQLFVYGKNTLR